MARLNLIYAVLGGALITLPFATLELLTRNPALPRSSFPMVLFVYLWFVAFAFVLLVHSLFRDWKTGQLTAVPKKLIIKLVILAFIGWSWSGLIVDQWPCFLGATGC